VKGLYLRFYSPDGSAAPATANSPMWPMQRQT